MQIDTPRLAWIASLLEEITLSDDERDLMVEIARRELVRARRGAASAERVEDLVQLLDDLSGDPIIVVRRPDQAQLHE